MEHARDADLVQGGVGQANGLSTSRFERSWRRPDDGLLARAQQLGRVFISRWRYEGSGVPVALSDANVTHHIIAINLSFTSVRFLHAGRLLIDGTLVPGAIHVTAPGVQVEATYRLPCDMLHIFVTQRVLSQCYEDIFGEAPDGQITLDDPSVRRDVTVERLGQLLASAEFWDRTDRSIFSDSIGRAIVSRTVENWCCSTPPIRQRSFGLAKWRLAKTMAYVDAHLEDRITLNQLAESAGFSRMHFAAQFRLAVGVSPHEYILRKRLDRAQKLMLETEQSIVDIALSCGFNSQTHFIAVFSRFMGNTPFRWRRDSRRG